MKKCFNLDADRIYVVLGIGNPNNQYKSNEIVRYEGIDYIDNTGYVKEKKNIVKTIQRLIKHITVHRV